MRVSTGFACALASPRGHARARVHADRTAAPRRASTRDLGRAARPGGAGVSSPTTDTTPPTPLSDPHPRGRPARPGAARQRRSYRRAPSARAAREAMSFAARCERRRRIARRCGLPRVWRRGADRTRQASRARPPSPGRVTRASCRAAPRDLPEPTSRGPLDAPRAFVLPRGRSAIGRESVLRDAASSRRTQGEARRARWQGKKGGPPTGPRSFRRGRCLAEDGSRSTACSVEEPAASPIWYVARGDAASAQAGDRASGGRWARVTEPPVGVRSTEWRGFSCSIDLLKRRYRGINTSMHASMHQTSRFCIPLPCLSRFALF